MQPQFEYDIIVVGGGHAGSEAAHAAAKLGHKTLLVTYNFDHIASMPCNPSVGGPAKGVVVREVEALGGLMGQAADATALQVKLLNASRGPAVWALRTQNDREAYSKYIYNRLKTTANLTLMAAAVDSLLIENQTARGIVLANQTIIRAQAVILTTGTYLKATILQGQSKTSSGPDNQPTSTTISKQLVELGFKLLRLKTGTPPRVYKNSVDYQATILEPGTDKHLSFSPWTKTIIPFKDQLPCYLTYTSKKTHAIVRENITASPMYSGQIKSAGPRYCPSIEDKVIKFAQKERHQLFIEPLTKNGDLVYLQGLSMCFPPEIQLKILHSIPGLTHCRVAKWAYAIEYDAVDPTQLKLSLETKLIHNLFTAGQINGTSGYEEAAGQGIIAGINAHLKLKQQPPLILKRSQAYIGVMIDDLVTKGVTDPYRLLTSRAEYRLLLRNDNAELRLTPLARTIGLISDTRWHQFEAVQKQMKSILNACQETRIKPQDPFAEILKCDWGIELHQGEAVAELLKRPALPLTAFAPLIPAINQLLPVWQQTLEINIKFAGYVAKQKQEVKKWLKLEQKQLPPEIDYREVDSLANEAREKLIKIRPESIGQASRISGINPADIQMLLLYLRKSYPQWQEKNHEPKSN